MRNDAFSGLTANQHDANGEDLLRVGVRRHVSESHTGEATEGKIQSGYIFILDGGARGAIAVVVLLADLFCKVVQPADLHTTDALRAGALHVSDGIPNARQPVSDERKGAHEEEEHCSAVFRVTVQFSRHPHQSQQPCRL